MNVNKCIYCKQDPDTLYVGLTDIAGTEISSTGYKRALVGKCSIKNRTITNDRLIAFQNASHWPVVRGGFVITASGMIVSEFKIKNDDVGRDLKFNLGDLKLILGVSNET